ncbi:dTDP-4-amino-4,6-dideoxygalactose transaminase [Urechidicola sp. KH5]
MKIPFNKPYLTGKESEYIQDAVALGKISGNGIYTNKCQVYFENKYNFSKCLLTTSCTDALEMAAILADIKQGDEVIIPSFTFVSTAQAFIRQGATIVFADSYAYNPNIDAEKIEPLITPQTKAIVVVHYAGVACDMKKIMAIAAKYNLIVVEDAAQAIDSFYNDIALGSIGHMSTFSFHETKNIISGEGGMLVVNDDRFISRAEIIWEKGTNRAAFFRGEIDKYNWVDIGSSFLPSEIIAAFLWAQIENLEKIQLKRKTIWNMYFNKLKNWASSNNIELMHIPDFASNNAHMFYLICESNQQRQSIIKHLKSNQIMAVFHYISLHSSPFYENKHDGRILENSDKFTNRLLRLPLYVGLDIDRVVMKICEFGHNE